MTTTEDMVDTARAQDLDEAHVAWCMHPMNGRTRFGVYAIDYLRERGVIVARDVDLADYVHPPALAVSGVAADPEPLECGEQPADLLGLRWGLGIARVDSPFVEQAVAMSVEEIADLLAALAERDLRWTPGEGGPDAEPGTLLEGAPEPPALHVVFDRLRAAWQRDDDRARDEDDLCAHWFGPNGFRRAWPDLQRHKGPLTPDGGIAPTTGRRHMWGESTTP